MIGNGQSISLWFDRWIDQVSIADRFPSLQFSEQDLVADIIEENLWCIPNHPPNHLKNFLDLFTSSISIASNSEDDHLLWQDSSSGDLSIKEAWNLLRTRENETLWSGFIWNKMINPRLACFSWRLMLRKTPT